VTETREPANIIADVCFNVDVSKHNHSGLMHPPPPQPALPDFTGSAESVQHAVP
jgi:hypothetical protein